MQAQIAERWETQNEAGRRFFGKGDFARAEQAFAAAVREAEQLGAGDLRLATSLANLAQLKLRQRNYDEADRLFRRSLQIREAALGHDHASLVQTVNGLAAVCYARGDIDAAEPLFQRALSITERRLGAQHPDIVISLNSLARIAFKRSDYAAAGPLLERLLMLKESSLGSGHPESAPILTSLVKVRAAEGALDEAERLARRVVAIRESEQPPSEQTLASSLELLADVLARLRKPHDEQSARQRAAALRAHPAATAGLMPLSPRTTPEDIFVSTPIPSSLRSKVTPPEVRPPTLGGPTFSLLENTGTLPDNAGTEVIGAPPPTAPIVPIVPLSASIPVASPITEMPRISMDGSTDEVMPRRKTPSAAPPPLPETPRPAVVEATVEGAGSEIVPIPAAPPRPAPPRPAPVAVTRPPARHYVPKPRTPRRESTGPRPRRRRGRKMMVALAVLLSAGAAAAAMSRGGVIESRGVTSKPAREFRAPPRRPRVAPVAQPRVDSALAASVRDSVALLIGAPPVQQQPPRESPEVNVPARVRRRDPRDQQIQQMLPDTRQAEPEPPAVRGQPE
jgi:tetratricopeptide (TPR) repeat protein